jgi:hypothetical protein
MGVFSPGDESQCVPAEEPSVARKGIASPFAAFAMVEGNIGLGERYCQLNYFSIG